MQKSRCQMREIKDLRSLNHEVVTEISRGLREPESVTPGPNPNNTLPLFSACGGEAMG